MVRLDVESENSKRPLRFMGTGGTSLKPGCHVQIPLVFLPANFQTMYGWQGEDLADRSDFYVRVLRSIFELEA